MKEKQNIKGTEREITMEAGSNKFKVMCVTDDGAFDFKVLKNVEVMRDEVSKFIDSNLDIHKDAKWVILPCDAN